LAALAVCCLTLGVAIVIWKLPPQSTVPPATRVSVAVPEPARTYITRIGEQRRIELPDGSHLTLNTGTRVTVAFIDRQRRLQLEAGEALFEVVPDAHRPFLVYAGSGLVRALGTVFSVYLRDTGHVSVLVAEGKVQLASVATQQTAAGEPPGMPLAVLGAGKVASFGNAVDSVESLPQAELSRRLAWREGLVKFDGEPLWQVVEEVSRYTTLKILIRDTHTANMRIGGHFKIGGTDALFEALQSGFGLRIERVGKDTVYLSRDSG
jgi:transmembrane sensor